MNSPSSFMNMDELVGEISTAEHQYLSPDTVRRCLNLLGEIVEEHTRKGRRVEVEWLGSFSSSPEGQLTFSDEPTWE